MFRIATHSITKLIELFSYSPPFEIVATLARFCQFAPAFAGELARYGLEVHLLCHCHIGRRFKIAQPFLTFRSTTVSTVRVSGWDKPESQSTRENVARVR